MNRDQPLLRGFDPDTIALRLALVRSHWKAISITILSVTAFFTLHFLRHGGSYPSAPWFGGGFGRFLAEVVVPAIAVYSCGYTAPISFAVAFARRTRGLYCARCGYEVWAAGVDAMPARCPECGADLSKRNAAIGARMAIPQQARIWIGVVLGSAWGLLVLWHGVRDYF